ncbi:SGNH/GDSL hydrolase family protein [Bacillus badius]|uniref:SGNH/GDSL hydrolase family protein n=1 Tax=Bacillus badius TaxID=1455 RepID=UPI0005AE0449|nr:GDSL-type esterase/lipase family protein [Bacillus badius]KIL74849.1 putative platelet-activating factor acetylhydrolase IB gamma subunit [Bacillus badius]
MNKIEKWLVSGMAAAGLLISSVPFNIEAATTKTDRVVAFGDSNTSGSYLPKEFPKYPTHNWPNVAGVVNKGVSGNTTAQAIKRFKKDVLDLNPAAVVMMFGLNDALINSTTGQPQVSKAQFEKNLTSMVLQLKERHTQVILMTNLPVNEGVYYKYHSADNPKIREIYTNKGGLRKWENSYNDIIRKVAKTHKVQLVDNYANAVLKAGNATDTKISKSGLVDPLLGFHWTPKGHSMVAYSVNHYLNQMFPYAK